MAVLSSEAINSGEVAKLTEYGAIFLTPPEHEGWYLTVIIASELTGYATSTLRKLARRGTLRAASVNGRRYFLAKDVDKLKVPEGYLPVGAAAARAGYSEDYVRRLAGRETIRRTYFKRGLYVSVADLSRYEEVPKGFIARKNAAAKYGFTVRHLKKLASSGKIRVIRTRTGRYLSEDDLRRRTEVPEGFISYEDGARKYGYNKGYLGLLAKQRGFERKRVGKRGFVKETDIERYVASLGRQAPAMDGTAPVAEEPDASAPLLLTELFSA
ncbi:MAG: helix-turn-helix domain-containing protein [Candidatus Aenigmarchaeota archaeon]|nr:helix-turn-helix domain-containing protein [Candidatus Aenigmarchaeota archaeon]